MNLNDYFDPVSIEKPETNFVKPKAQFGHNIYIHTPDIPIPNIDEYRIAVLGVPEERNSFNKGCSKAPDLVRQSLYKLHKFNKNLNIIDLGNLKQGGKAEDTYFGLRETLSFLYTNNVTPIIIGGSQDISYGVILAYENLNKMLSYVTVDARLDLNLSKGNIHSEGYLKEIFKNKTRFLFNYTNIGHQSCFTDKNDLELLKNLYYESFRLGEVRSNLKMTEPVIRDADFVSIDFNAIKQADAPGNYQPSPNGFFGEEICQLSKYCGMSDQLTTFLLSEINPEFDLHGQTTHLAAQTIWYFISGFLQKKYEKPDGSENFTKFVVNLDATSHNLVFYKSEHTNRWWLEIPSVRKKPYLIACAYEDYLAAGNQEIPDRWWKAYQKVN